MTKTTRRRRGKALIALVAALAAFAGGGQALFPAPAAAMEDDGGNCANDAPWLLAALELGLTCDELTGGGAAGGWGDDETAYWTASDNEEADAAEAAMGKDPGQDYWAASDNEEADAAEEAMGQRWNKFAGRRQEALEDSDEEEADAAEAALGKISQDQLHELQDLRDHCNDLVKKYWRLFDAGRYTGKFDPESNEVAQAAFRCRSQLRAEEEQIRHAEDEPTPVQAPGQAKPSQRAPGSSNSKKQRKKRTGKVKMRR